jgi:hypothetical protein
MVPRTSVNATPDQPLDRIAVAVRGILPPGSSPAHLDGFVAQHRCTLVVVLERELRARQTRSGADKRPVPLTDAPQELWTRAEGKNSRANLDGSRRGGSGGTWYATRVDLAEQNRVRPPRTIHHPSPPRSPH